MPFFGRMPVVGAGEGVSIAPKNLPHCTICIMARTMMVRMGKIRAKSGQNLGTACCFLGEPTGQGQVAWLRSV